MKLNELKPKNGATTGKKRVGRGIGSGTGKTSGHGQKGQKSRSGVAINGFEGGQMPIYRRLPKRGFNKRNRKVFAEVNLSQLQIAIEAGKLDVKAEVNAESLIKAGVIRRELDGVRVLGKGVLKEKVSLKITGITEAAKAAVEKAGGKVELIVIERAPVVRKKKI